MSDPRSMKDLTFHWKRPPGPLNIWKTIESTKHSKNGKPIKYIIQDIPKERYQDALDHMTNFFLRDEPTCSTLDLLSDEVSMDEIQTFWLIVLEQGISIGAFVEGQDGEKPILAGLNMLYVISKEDEPKLEKISNICRSQRTKTLFYTTMKLGSECDVKKIYNIDKYMSAFGLSVDPAYRGEKLGQVILSTRNDIGRKYGIAATETEFTAGTSQYLAERVGFKVGIEKDFSEITTEDGSPAFPLLAGKPVKVMHMRLE